MSMRGNTLWYNSQHPYRGLALSHDGFHAIVTTIIYYIDIFKANSAAKGNALSHNH